MKIMYMDKLKNLPKMALSMLVSGHGAKNTALAVLSGLMGPDTMANGQTAQ